MIINESGGSSLSRTVRGTIASFNTKTGNIPLKSLVVDIEPMQAGTGDPSPENVRPISGWTGAKVQRTGKNLFDKSNYVRSPVYVDAGSKKYGYLPDRGVILPIKPKTTYTVKKDTSTVMRAATSVDYPAENGAITALAAHSSANNAPLSVTSGDNDHWMVVQLFANSDVGGGNDSIEANAETLMVSVGSTATDYEPYQGTTYDISFPDEAGTVYGGTLDVTTGLLTVDKQGYDMGALNWGRQAGSINPDVYLFRAQTPVSSTVTANQGLGISTMFATVTANLVFGGQAPDNTIGIAGSYANIRCDSYAEASAFKAAVSGQLVVVPVSPITYQLTPTEVNTLLGVNNIWADAGDSEVVYWTNPEIIHVINSSGLNLKVVGGTSAPTSPAENTVWVNTSTAINGYAFSATAPTNPVEGMVWFRTGTNANAPINIDKKNTVILYPTSCQQYIGGVWVSKTAKTYLNSAWKDWTVYLYNLGDECTSITGGWDDYLDNAGYSITKGADYLKIKGVNNQYSGTGSTTNAVDLTKYSTLHAIVKRTSSGTCNIGISAKRNAAASDLTAKKAVTTTAYNEVTLDISGYNSAYYIVLTVDGTDELYIQKIWLE